MNKNRRILVVEDDDAVWSLLSQILEAVPCEAERVVGGSAALDLLRKGGFDAVLLDLMIPEISGLEFLEKLNADPDFKGFRILVDSCVAGTSHAQNELKRFVNLRIETLVRPSDPATVIEKVQELLGLPLQLKPLAAPVLVRKRVLIVDDDPGVREIYVPFFMAKGYDAASANDGKAALDSLKAENIDLLILDLDMPQISGEEVMAAMAAHPQWKNIPVILDTKLRSESERVKKINADFMGRLRFEFFQRPTNLDDIAEAIQRILII
jgi:CheY-like chemotaxis protein